MPESDVFQSETRLPQPLSVPCRKREIQRNIRLSDAPLHILHHSAGLQSDSRLVNDVQSFRWKVFRYPGSTVDLFLHDDHLRTSS